MRIRSLLILSVLALCACTTVPRLPPLNAAKAGPVVSGVLKGSTAPAYIPFSDYATGDPTIATEAFVAAAVAGAPQGGGAPSGPAAGDLAGTYPAPTIAQATGLNLFLDAPNITALRNANNPQTFRLYNIQGANSVYGQIGWWSNYLTIETGRTGQGGVHDIVFRINGTTIMGMTSVGGQITAGAGYIPSGPNALTTKTYVDNAVAAMQAKIDALTTALAAKVNGSTGAARPTMGHPGTVGYQFWDLNAGAPVWWDGEQWIHADGNP